MAWLAFSGAAHAQANEVRFVRQLGLAYLQFHVMQDKRMLEAMIRTADEIWPDALFAVHLDHGDEETCYDCINSGFFSSVMIDASHEPYDKNIDRNPYNWYAGPNHIFCWQQGTIY